MKECYKCKETKPLDSFNKNSRTKDRKNYYCKECCRLYSQSEKGKASQRKSQESPHGKASRRMVQRRDKTLNSRKSRNKKYNNAHNKVRSAITNGELTPQCCIFCGEVETEAHHDDYSNPLDVVWVCKKHHTDIHHNDLKLEVEL
jgi:hypothetical protein